MSTDNSRSSSKTGSWHYTHKHTHTKKKYLKQVGSFTPTQQMETIYDEGVETVEQVVQINCKCPIIVSAESQAGQGFEQPDQVSWPVAQGLD